MSQPSIFSHVQHKLSSAAPHLPPIRPPEQTRRVRGRVTPSSLGIAGVVVLIRTAEPVGRFAQTEGAHRPGGRRQRPRGENWSGASLPLSHVGFRMKALFDCLLLSCCSLSTTVRPKHKETIEHRGHDWMGSRHCEDHAQTGTCLMWNIMAPSHNEEDSLLTQPQLFRLCIRYECTCRGAILWPISIPHPISNYSTSVSNVGFRHIVP